MAICNALLTSEFNAPREGSKIHHKNIYVARVSRDSVQTGSMAYTMGKHEFVYNFLYKFTLKGSSFFLLYCHCIKLGQDPCPCAFDIVDMVPYTISKLSAESQFCAIQTADNTDGKVRIEIILLLENNKMLPRKIKTETK